MHRVLEPELMLRQDQVQAYAEADFSQAHNAFIEQIIASLGSGNIEGKVLDLGCGPGDVSMRFALAFPECCIDAVDGSETMLSFGRRQLPEQLQQQISFHFCYLPDDPLPVEHYDILISNSLLHHLPDPDVLWSTIKQYAKPGSRVFIMDLLRPENIAKARELMLTYGGNEAEVLRIDFYNSLLAAFTLDEIRQQLNHAQLSLTAEQISDRHVYISGII